MSVTALHQVVHSFFQAEREADQDLLLGLQVVQAFAAGERLFAAGEDADSLHLVLKGCFAVHKPIGLGSRSQVVALLEAGTVIGEAAIVAGRRRCSTVIATDDSVVASFSRDALLKIEAIAPALYLVFVKKILSITSLRLQKSSDRLALVL
ncbi:cyclic nucleotide-binding domain-containing protein [Desulfopila aestuarii]|uniref:Cyclic nucleotide-binding domain-containing protein n=1 Tax=Desulfopila aestuarii DSM 18488 TaxID=1121416 RepID=A0A1M7YEM7_9BACT|nr:cyclic nucleotide-binding domain-containing protein [Desulfopila aestuarii]SHO51031.1 Cyclic nucleotide-binding domain-containing protein [Desulfopila aestuarii DSM 18488]